MPQIWRFGLPGGPGEVVGRVLVLWVCTGMEDMRAQVGGWHESGVWKGTHKVPVQ